MKNKVIKQLNRLIAFVLGVLGFSSLTGCLAPEYGCPYEPYDIQRFFGYVVDESGNPIKDIEVSCAQTFSNADGSVDTVYIRKTRSNPDGSFKMDVDVIDLRDNVNLLIATDVDGEANGSYETAVKNISINNYGLWEEHATTFVLREKPTTSEPEDNGEDDQA